MGSILNNMLEKIRAAKAPKVEDQTKLVEAEAYARWASEPYYEIFIKGLETQAMTAGLDQTDGNALLVAQGERKAYIKIIADLRRNEKIARERLRSDSDDGSDEDSDSADRY